MNIGIITGASSGLGREFALHAKNKYKDLDQLWLIARREERLKKLEEKLSVPVRIIRLDLLQDGSLAQLEALLKAQKPTVKLLVNAAGYGKIGKIGELDLIEETGIIRLNCEVLAGITHIVLPFMKEGGSILNFASAAAFLPQPKFSIYAASKSFVLSYSRALREEVKQKNITVTAVCPGPVKTEFFKIAGNKERMPLIKSMTMADAKDVIHLAIKDNQAGKGVSIYGFLIKTFYLLTKMIPHRILLKAVSYLN